MHGHGLGDRQQRRDVGHRVRGRTDRHPAIGLGASRPSHHRLGIDAISHSADPPGKLFVAEGADTLTLVRPGHHLGVDGRALLRAQTHRLTHDDEGSGLAQLARLEGGQGVRHLAREGERETDVLRAADR